MAHSRSRSPLCRAASGRPLALPLARRAAMRRGARHEKPARAAAAAAVVARDSGWRVARSSRRVARCYSDWPWRRLAPGANRRRSAAAARRLRASAPNARPARQTRRRRSAPRCERSRDPDRVPDALLPALTAPTRRYANTLARTIRPGAKPDPMGRAPSWPQARTASARDVWGVLSV